MSSTFVIFQKSITENNLLKHYYLCTIQTKFKAIEKSKNIISKLYRR